MKLTQKPTIVHRRVVLARLTSAHYSAPYRRRLAYEARLAEIDRITGSVARTVAELEGNSTDPWAPLYPATFPDNYTALTAYNQADFMVTQPPTPPEVTASIARRESFSLDVQQGSLGSLNTVLNMSANPVGAGNMNMVDDPGTAVSSPTSANGSEEHSDQFDLRSLVDRLDAQVRLDAATAALDQERIMAGFFNPNAPIPASQFDIANLTASNLAAIHASRPMASPFGRFFETASREPSSEAAGSLVAAARGEYIASCSLPSSSRPSNRQPLAEIPIPPAPARDDLPDPRQYLLSPPTGPLPPLPNRPPGSDAGHASQATDPLLSNFPAPPLGSLPTFSRMPTRHARSASQALPSRPRIGHARNLSQAQNNLRSNFMAPPSGVLTHSNILPIGHARSFSQGAPPSSPLPPLPDRLPTGHARSFSQASNKIPLGMVNAGPSGFVIQAEIGNAALDRDADRVGRDQLQEAREEEQRIHAALRANSEAAFGDMVLLPSRSTQMLRIAECLVDEAVHLTAEARVAERCAAEAIDRVIGTGPGEAGAVEIMDNLRNHTLDERRIREAIDRAMGVRAAELHRFQVNEQRGRDAINRAFEARRPELRLVHAADQGSREAIDHAFESRASELRIDQVADSPIETRAIERRLSLASRPDPVSRTPRQDPDLTHISEPVLLARRNTRRHSPESLVPFRTLRRRSGTLNLRGDFRLSPQSRLAGLPLTPEPVLAIRRELDEDLENLRGCDLFNAARVYMRSVNAEAYGSIEAAQPTADFLNDEDKRIVSGVCAVQ